MEVYCGYVTWLIFIYLYASYISVAVCCLRTLLLCFALFFQDVVSRCRCRDSSLNTYWIRSKQLSVVDQTTMKRQLSSIHIQTWLACVCHQPNTQMTIIMATRILQMLCKAQKFTLAILTTEFDSKNMTHSSDALRRFFFDNAQILFEWHDFSFKFLFHSQLTQEQQNCSSTLWKMFYNHWKSFESIPSMAQCVLEQ